MMMLPPYWAVAVKLIVCESFPIPCDASAIPVYLNAHVPDDLPMSRRKSVAVVLTVTSGIAVPTVGLNAKTFRVNWGAARFVRTVIFLVDLLVPHRRFVV
jgi:hypothetical protein